MIFATVGSTPYAFDRLLTAFLTVPLGGEDVVLQCGASAVRPGSARCFDYLPESSMRLYADRARAIVCHAGVGSVALALRSGKRPIVVPRRRALGENVDDHQLDFALRLERLGVATVVLDPGADLEAALARPALPRPARPGPSPGLVDELVAYLDASLRREPRRGRLGQRIRR